jgi:hypothetical protein
MLNGRIVIKWGDKVKSFETVHIRLGKTTAAIIDKCENVHGNYCQEKIVE